MKPVAMFQKRSTIYFMNIPEIYIYEGERNEDFLHLKRYPCEECAGVYERPVLNQPSNRSEATSREVMWCGWICRSEKHLTCINSLLW